MELGDGSREARASRAVSVDLLILCYHAVSHAWDCFLAVEPDRLRAQVRHLLRRGYRARTLSDALAAPPRERTFVVTFDDGYLSTLELGLPVLEKLGVPATAFVPTDLIEEAGLFRHMSRDHLPADEAELRCMSWDGVRRLADAGWEVGSHSCAHPHLTEVDEGRLDEELRRSRALCEERLQRPCISIAYPYGSHDRRVMEATGRAGYRFAVTLEERLFEPICGRGPLDLPREGIFRETRWPKYLLNTSRTLRRVRLSDRYDRVAFGRLRSAKQ